MFTNIKTINYRPLCITILIVCVMNLLFTVFTGSTTKHVGIPHDGVCACDGLDPNCEYVYYTGTDSSLAIDIEKFKDFQFDVQYNGDIIIYTMEDEFVQLYVGTYKHGSKCDIIKMLEDYMNEED